jgi:WD40 repeat protein
MSSSPTPLQPSQTYQIENSKINCLIVLSNFTILGTNEGDLKHFLLYQAEYPEIVSTPTDVSSISNLLIHQNSNLIISGSQLIQIFSISIDTSSLNLNKIQTLSGHTDQVIGLGLIKNFLYSASEDSKVFEWDLNTFNSKILYQHDSAVISFDVCDKSKTIVSCCAEPCLKIYEDQRVNYCVKLETKIWSVRFMEGKILAGDHEGNLFFINESGITGKIGVHESRVKCIELDFASRRVFTASFDQKVAVLDFDLKVKAVGCGHEDWVRTVKVLDRDRIVTAGDDSKVIVWGVKMKKGKRKGNWRCGCSLL